jgi:hypothetical protein
VRLLVEQRLSTPSALPGAVVKSAILSSVPCRARKYDCGRDLVTCGLRLSSCDPGSMFLSLAYRATSRVLGFVAVLFRREVSKDAELLVLRHENTVLRRQIVRVRYGPADRFWFAALSSLIPRRRWTAVSQSVRRLCWPGTADWLPASGTTAPGKNPAGHRPPQRSKSSCSRWPKMIRCGATAGSRANWSSSATRSRPRRYGRS